MEAKRILLVDDDAKPDQGWAAGLVTRSPRVQAVLEDARRVASTDSAVLITGANGTGKEVLARVIHRASPRAGRPFVTINCTVGSFTGAQNDHLALFRAADCGSVFLDEVGDLPGELQVKLLRVLQERAVRPAGETRAVPVDVRVLSASHSDLESRIAAGTFSEDLFRRLNAVRLRLPALDERREDIPLLVAHRLQQLVEGGAPKRVYSPEALEVLVAAAWPGNVRQLFKVVEQNVALAAGRVISGALVRRSLGESGSGLPSFDEARADFTRAYLRQVLELAGGNISRAARLAGRNRTDLYKLLHRHGISPAEFKGAQREGRGDKPTTHRRGAAGA